MIPDPRREERLSPRQSHGLKALKRAVKVLGSRTIDQRTKALGNLTPREAAKTPEGRERLEALLLSYEWDKPGEGLTGLMQPDVAELRRRLGLG